MYRGLLRVGLSLGVAACLDLQSSRLSVPPVHALSIVLAGHSAFPSVIQTPSGAILVAFRNGLHHIDPSGRIVIRRLHVTAEGLLPDTTVAVIDTELDDRDPALTLLGSGHVLLTFLGSSVDHWLPQRISVMRSSDDGTTWSTRSDIAPANVAGSPPVAWYATRSRVLEIAAGQLVMPVYAKLPRDSRFSSHTLVSSNDGATWEYDRLMARDPAQLLSYWEPSLSAGLNELIGSFRTDVSEPGPLFGLLTFARADARELTWSAPSPSSQFGYPADVLRTKTGALLMAFGYRRVPYGVRLAVISHVDNAWSVDSSVTVDDGSDSPDCGYPSLLQLHDGRVLLAYYTTQREQTFIRLVLLGPDGLSAASAR